MYGPGFRAMVLQGSVGADLLRIATMEVRSELTHRFWCGGHFEVLGLWGGCCTVLGLGFRASGFRSVRQCQLSRHVMLLLFLSRCPDNQSLCCLRGTSNNGFAAKPRSSLEALGQ